MSGGGKGVGREEKVETGPRVLRDDGGGPFSHLPVGGVRRHRRRADEMALSRPPAPHPVISRVHSSAVSGRLDVWDDGIRITAAVPPRPVRHYRYSALSPRTHNRHRRRRRV